MLKFFLVAHLTYENHWGKGRSKKNTFSFFGTPYSGFLYIFTDQNDVLAQFFYSHRHCVDAPTVLQQSPTIEVATILMQPISPQLHVNASKAL